MKNPVVIHWIDIVGWTGWNQELIDNDEAHCSEFWTVGYVVSMDDKELVITDCANEIGNITVFPVGVIQSITEYEAKKSA